MSEPDWWPPDLPGYVFLARAVEKIGAARREDWTGAETTTEVVEPIPSKLDDAKPIDKWHADGLLRVHRPELGRPNNPSGYISDFTDEHWRIACELAQRLHVEGRPAIQRLRAAQNEIVRSCAAGELVLQTRSVRGSPWNDFEKQWWNINKPEARFNRCRINPSDPFGDQPDENDHWIFVTEESLDQILRPSTEPALQPVSTKQPKRKRKHRQDPARTILILTFPNGLPTDNGVLFQKAAEEWKRRKIAGDSRFQGKVPARITFLRAVGRAK
jgi:hypothetical protein